jgi:hypothetical protein
MLCGAGSIESPFSFSLAVSVRWHNIHVKFVKLAAVLKLQLGCLERVYTIMFENVLFDASWMQISQSYWILIITFFFRASLFPTLSHLASTLWSTFGKVSVSLTSSRQVACHWTVVYEARGGDCVVLLRHSKLQLI